MDPAPAPMRVMGQRQSVGRSPLINAAGEGAGLTHLGTDGLKVAGRLTRAGRAVYIRMDVVDTASHFGSHRFIMVSRGRSRILRGSESADKATAEFNVLSSIWWCIGMLHVCKRRGFC